jgi:dolichol-phosphate mannosyltransferase
VRRFADDILVIDDGSTDHTPLQLARQPVEVIRHARNRGYGRSLIDAFRWSQCYSFDWLITMDCDEQHEPASLPDFYAAIERDDADVISGSRYLGADACGDPPPADRRTINTALTGRINEHLGLNITDAFCGFKAYRVSAIKKLELDEAGYAFPLQFWVQAAAHDLRVIEVPIRLIYNDAQRSFGGPLDDPQRRLSYYNTVLARELGKFEDKFGRVCCVKCAAGEADPTAIEQVTQAVQPVGRD